MKKATIYRKQQRSSGNKARTQRQPAFIPAIEAASAGSDHFIPAIQRKCSACKEDEQLQRKEKGSNQFFAPSRVKNYIQTLDSSGSKLSPAANQFFSPHFGYDFSHVKIHTGKEAEASANEINAEAYTTGNHIIFNEGKYQPETSEGKKLLAHELTHVVQQSKSLQRRLVQRKLITHPTKADPNFVFEAEAKLYAFSDLAKMYGSTTSAITAANPKLKANIKVGDLITIPAVNYPAGVTAASGPPQAGIVVSSGTNAIDMRWNSGAGSNRIGTVLRGKSIQVVSNGCWVNIADLSTKANGVIDELKTLGLATSTKVFGHIDTANQRLASATVSTADQDMLARMIWGEQRGQGYDAMVGAAWIVMNRYKGGWGTIGQIVSAPNQFQGLVGPGAVKGLSGKDLAMWTDAQAIAAGVIGGTIADTTSGYKFFGNGSAMKAKMDTCAKSNSAFSYHVISGTNFYYSNGDYTSSKCRVE